MNNKEGISNNSQEKKDFELPDTEVKTKSYIASSFSMIKQKMMIILVVLGAVLAIYFIFTDGSSKKNVVTTNTESFSKERLEDLSAKSKPVNKEVPAEELQIPQKIPELPKLTDPVLPLSIATPPVQVKKPVVPTLGNVPVEVPQKVFANKPNIDTPMLVISSSEKASSASTATPTLSPQDLLDPKKIEEFKRSLQSGNGNIVTEESEIKRTPDQVLATHRGNLDYVIGTGKTIDVILENGINTELSGVLRGMVSRDTYSESGNIVLVPKGSRLIGTYSTNISVSQSRVDVKWTVIKMPNGMDIQVDSIGTDQLGRSGAVGIVDSKFHTILTSSLILSGIQAGSGQIANWLSNGSPITTTTIAPSATNPSGSISTTGSASAIAAAQAVNSLSQAMTDYINKYTNTNPVIRVKQGERVKVFVQKDLVFPRSAFGPTSIQ